VNRAFALLALAGLAVSPLRNSAQERVEELKEGSLAVKVHALVPGSGAEGLQGTGVAWQEESVKYTLPGIPVGVKLVGTNLVVMTQVTPFDRGDGKLSLVAQGQVWARNARGSITYRSTLETVTLSLGETVFFYPLGVDAGGKSPLRLEISVSRRPVEPELPAREAGAPQPPQPGPAPAPAVQAPPPEAPKPKR